MMSRLLTAASVLALAATTLAACVEGPAARAGLRPTQGVETAQGPRSSYGLFLAGQAAIGQGSSRDAAAYFGRASAQTPDVDDLRTRAFSAALLAGDLPRAAAVAPAAGEGTPAARSLGRLVQAVEQLTDNKGQAAERLLSGPEPIVAPHQAAAVLLKPWAAFAAGDTASAVMRVDPPGAQLDAFAALERAQLLERAGKLREADQVFRTELADKPGVFALAHGLFLERRGRRPEAVAIYDAALARSPRDVAFKTARARAAAGRPAPPLPTVREGAAQALIGPAAAMLASKEGELGLTYLRLALRLDPKLSQAWLLVGDAMTATGDKEAARDAYRKVLPTAAEYTTARGRLALLLQSDDDKAGALALARETARAAPDDPQALLILGELLRDGEQYAEAAVTFDRLIALGGADADWRLYYLRGASRERSGDWPGAQADLTQALKMKPDQPEVLNYLGYAWADRGEHLPQALAMLQKATELQPDSGAIVDSLGWARYRLRDYPAAVRDLERAVGLDAADPEVNLHLGDAYWRTGRRLEAQYQWRRVLTLQADARVKALAQARLTDGPEAALASPAARR